MKYTLNIEGRLDGLNDYTLANRRNRFAGAKMKKENESIILEAINEQLPGVVIEKPVFIYFKWIEPNRRRDYDNIAFAKKFFLDSFQEVGLLKNDNHNYVKGFQDTFDYDKKNPHIEVIIEECED